MAPITYRNHDLGPLVDIFHRPGWITIRLTFDLPGSFIPGHLHYFDHFMTVDSGVLSVSAESGDRVCHAGDSVLIKAGERHGLVSLKSGTVARCEHEIRHENGELFPEAFAPDGVPIEWLKRIEAP